jgi:hypothetical protein
MVNSICINLPYLFPQLHWWNRAIHSDKIILLDDIKYNKSFPINRALVFDGKKAKYININIKKEKDLIYRIIANETFSKQKVTNLFLEYYKKEKHVRDIEYILHIWLSYINSNKLLDITLDSIKVCSDYLDIDFNYLSSSNFRTFHLKNERLIELCKQENITELVLGLGSVGYIEDNLEKYKDNGIDIKYKNWDCPVENYSILDCIARYGLDKTKEILEI